ncbi:MAG TPA: aminotransferase class III-fold pyridoxal phosphate-dependent enzyme [Actinomycetota bacterium]
MDDVPGGVLEADPPRFSADEASAIAARLFGVEGPATPLASERDQGFLLGGGVLKISNAGERPEVLDMETAAALHVRRVDPDLPLAMPIPLVRTDPPAYRAEVGGHLIRMFERLPGRASVPGAELGLDAVRAFGEVLARLGRALRGFFHPAAGRVILWDVQHALSLRHLLGEIEDEEARALADRALRRFEERALPAWPLLRAQVIHGDLSLDNALLDEEGRVTGIVDLGDMSHTALLCDLSSALASVLGGREGDEAFRTARVLLDGYQRITPLEPEEIELLPLLLEARLAATVVISAWRVRRYPQNAEYIAGWDEETWPLLRLLDEMGAEEAAARLGAPRAAPTEDLARRRRRLLGPALSPLTYRRPVHAARAEGVWIVETDGRRLLDAYNNVPTVGHSHPRVAEAVARQSRLLATNARYLYEPLIELAERLVGTMPSALDTVTLVNSGTEANDLAWRLAVAWTDAPGAIVTAHAYYGVSAATADLSPETWREPSDHVETFGPPGEGAGRAIERLAARGLRPAALFLDGGFTSDGILVPGSPYVRDLAREIQSAGGLFVADEVQVGHGRTGEHLWSFAADGVTPDVVTMGKPMGNGFPVAAVVTRREIAARLAESTEVFSTFGGNPVAAAAALAVLDVIADEGLIERAAEVGGVLLEELRAMARRHDEVRDVRGRGLLIGVELASPAAPVADAMREAGVLVGVTGPRGEVLKIRPPLVFGPHHAARLVETLDRILGLRDPTPGE